jgi:type VI secretion system protein ImpL
MNSLIKFLKIFSLRDLLKNAELEKAAQELTILNHNLNDALRFLKRNYKKYTKLPLYLIMGPCSFGKTTLIANAGIDLAGVHGDSIANSDISTKYCEWWFSENAAYLDTAGIYFKTDKANPHSNLVWMGFLKSLQKFYLGRHIAGVLVVIDLPAVIDSKEKLDKTLSDVQERIYEVAKYTSKLPIHLLFTKCDLIAGFDDFVANLPPHEIDQPFGITFSKSGATKDPIRSFNAEFDKLLAKVNNKLLTFLHEEQLLEKRLKLKNFPLQLASLRNVIREIINETPKGAHIELNGVYFVSSTQQGIPKDYVNLPIFNNQQIKRQSYSLNVSTRPYFIKDLFEKIITTASNITTTEISWPSFVAAIAMSTAVAIGAVSLYVGYNKNLSALQTTQNALTAYAQTNNGLQLQNIITTLTTDEKSWWTHLGFNQTLRASNLLQKIYFTTAATDLIPQLQKLLETEITVANEEDPVELHDALETYLMLSYPDKLNKKFVSAWFANYWAKNLANAPEKREQLTMQLNAALAQGIKITPQQQVITTAREALSSHYVATEASVYNTLKNLYKTRVISLKLADQEITISKMFTAENFTVIYQQQIPDLVNNSGKEKEDWVIANKEQSQISSKDLSAVIDNVRTKYFKEYVDAWSTTLKTIKIPQITNLHQAATVLHNIADTDYQLLPLLKMIQVNTNIPSAPAEFTDLVSAKLSNLNSLDLKTLDSSFESLANYFSNITNSTDAESAAFMAVAAKFQNPNTQDALTSFKNVAAVQPDPIQSWMQNIATSSWKVLMNSTQAYLNSQWTTKVLPLYQNSLENRYPLAKNAKTSIAINDFTKFFGPNGTIDSFFKFYLKPFVDTTKAYWVWKEVNGTQLDIPQITLETFIRAALIQKMFFPENNLNIRFALTPIAMSPLARTFSANIDGQIITYEQGQKKTDHLNWPGPTPNNVSISFTNIRGQNITSNINNDPWAWFRLIDKSNITTTTGPQNYALVIDLNGSSIKYELAAEQVINPFIPEIINKFNCPKKL